jgi:hypothetical protein
MQPHGFKKARRSEDFSCACFRVSSIQVDQILNACVEGRCSGQLILFWNRQDLQGFPLPCAPVIWLSARLP